MNAAIRAVVRTSVFHDMEVVGVFQGYQGLIDGDFKRLHVRSVAKILGRGGTILKSARCQGFMSPEGRKRAHVNLVEAGVDGLVVIGGNGTFTGAMKFSRETGFPVVGLPGTIDNDLCGSDCTIGFDTAINTVNSARGTLGAQQNRMESALRSIQLQRENLSASESRIRDVDVAEETADLTRNSIMQQAATTILTQANVQPQIALTLLQG